MQQVWPVVQHAVPQVVVPDGHWHWHVVALNTEADAEAPTTAVLPETATE